MARTDRDWDQKYRSNETPWDSGVPSLELKQILLESQLKPTRALELGCGTGTNAIYLAEIGWDVTAIDGSEPALEVARQKSSAAGVAVDWVLADVQDFGAGRSPVDFVFDRGCYHCCRGVDLNGYMRTLETMTHPGSKMLCLCGNPNGNEMGGPPRVPRETLEQEFGPLFEFLQIREFRFQDPNGDPGPLGWSVWMSRK